MKIKSNMSDKSIVVEEIKQLVKNFVNEREWDQFHNPKNLAMSIAIEASELMELFQWISMSDAINVMESGKIRENAIDEIADILIYSISFCNSNDIDIGDAIYKKMQKNRIKYPVEKFKGRF